MGLLKNAVVAVPFALMTYFYRDNDLLGNSKLVQTTCGMLRGGNAVSRDGRAYMEYLGIPYAKPPVGSLRFEPPVPAESWKGTRDAVSYASQCLQIEFFTSKIVGTEDCLYLNVFRPVIRTKDPYYDAVGPRLLPVMVYFHGGYFMSGSSNTYGPDYFMDQDLVLVTLNYRLNAFGFLNTETHHLRGNQGLKDQNLALRWIQDNIRSFGGDPNRVTIFGGSAGGASVHYHILSPLSKNLFQRAISQSGTAIKVYSSVKHPREQANRLATRLGCPFHKTEAMVTCLKKMDALKIVQTTIEYRNVLLHPLAIYAPSKEYVLDNQTFLHDDPINLLKSGGISNAVPWLTGVNAEDGLIYTARIIRNRALLSEIESNWYNVAPKLLGYLDNDQREFTKILTNFYLPAASSTQIDFNWAFQNFTDMFSDRLYNTATHISIKEHAKQAPVYPYYYNYRSRFSFSNLLLLTGKLPPIVDIGIALTSNFIRTRLAKMPKSNLGVCHGDEVLMLFHLGVLSNVHNRHKDYEMSKDFVKLWVNFAYGEQLNLKFRNVTLSPYNPLAFDIPYLKIDRVAAVVNEPFADRARFGESVNLF